MAQLNLPLLCDDRFILNKKNAKIEKFQIIKDPENL